VKRLVLFPLLCCSCNLAYLLGGSIVGEGSAAVQEISQKGCEELKELPKKLEGLANSERDRVLGTALQSVYEKLQSTGLVADVLRKLADPTGKCRTPVTSLGGISEWCSVAKAKITKWMLLSALLASGLNPKVALGLGGSALAGGGVLLTVVGLLWKSRGKALDYITKRNATRRAKGVSASDMEQELKDAGVYGPVSGTFKKNRAALTARYLEEKEVIQNVGKAEKSEARTDSENVS